MKSLGLTKKGFGMLLAALSSMMCGHLYMMLMLFYVPFQNCFNLTNTQIATLLSVYSVTTIPFSIVFGRLSDAVSPKLCMYLPCFASAALGTLLCFNPSYPLLVIIFALMPIGACAWSSTLKCMKNLSPSNEYLGKIFGTANTFDGMISSITYLAFVFIFGDAIGVASNFKIMIWINNAITLAAGLIVFFFLDYDWIIQNSNNYVEPKPVSFVQSFVESIKVPEVWAVGILSIVYYGITCIVNYTSPYLINGFGFPVAYTTLFAVFSRYVLKTFAGSAGGRLRDKRGAMFKALRLMSIVTSVTLLAMAVLPMKSNLVLIAIILGSALIFFYTMMSTAASMTLTEYNPPANLHATMTAVVTIVGSLGTIIVSNVCGRILDAQPLTGYRTCFLIGIAIEAIFFFAGDILKIAAKMPHSMAKNRADHAFDKYVKD